MNETAALTTGWRFAGWTTLAVCVLMLAVAGFFASLAHTSLNEPQQVAANLDGVWYVVAAILAVPAAISVITTGFGMLVSRRHVPAAKTLLVLGALPVGGLTVTVGLIALWLTNL